jgi:hypothetical protein
VTVTYDKASHLGMDVGSNKSIVGVGNKGVCMERAYGSRLVLRMSSSKTSTLTTSTPSMFGEEMPSA